MFFVMELTDDNGVVGRSNKPRESKWGCLPRLTKRSRSMEEEAEFSHMETELSCMQLRPPVLSSFHLWSQQWPVHAWYRLLCHRQMGGCNQLNVDGEFGDQHMLLLNYFCCLFRSWLQHQWSFRSFSWGGPARWFDHSRPRLPLQVAALPLTSLLILLPSQGKDNAEEDIQK